MAAQQIFVLGTDGNLWLEYGPFTGSPIPPRRDHVDGSVDLFAAFQAFNSDETLVCGSDGNLWLEQGPFGAVPLPDSSYPPGPSSRFQIDGSVAAFEAWSPGEIFVLGEDGNLWLEFGFGTTIPAVPPPRNQIDGNVIGFQAMSLQEVFVLGGDGNLWHEWGPFGTVPLPPCSAGATSGCRSLVALNVRAFGAVDSNHVFFVDVNNDLYLQVGSFGSPPLHVDGNVAAILPVDSEEIYVLGTDGKLWLENAPFGTVPLPLCSQTTGFGKGFACRQLVAANVNAFGVSPDTGGVFIVDFNLNLVQLGTPPITIDGNVIAFQLLSAEQTFSRAHQHLRMRRARSAPRGGVGHGVGVPAS